MKLSDIGEFGLIERIKAGLGQALPEGFMGIGDDCASIPQRGGMQTLVSTDMLVEGAHFILEDIGPYRLGWKSAAVNISDVAAMGGRPLASFLAVALPKGLDSEWTDEFMRGYKEVSALSGCLLLGGDTTSSLDRLCVCVTVIGECPVGASVPRSGAKEGDNICVTGSLGDSGAGLRIILEGLDRDSVAEKLIEKHYMPVPRVEEGMALAATEGVHAMMDISDGIGSDLRHILKASGKGAVMNLPAFPLSEELRSCCLRYGWDPYELATGGGEEYELLFTASPSAKIPVPHYVIGKITAGSGIDWGGGKDYGGFHHF